MVQQHWRGDNRGVMEHRHATPEPKTQRRPSRVAEMQGLLDERDETIRLLNEALSRALDELRLTSRAA
jgi:hypothetical protein